MDKSLTSMPERADELIQKVLETLTAYGLDVLGALAILALGLWFAGWSARFARRALSRNRYVDPTLLNFAASFIRYLVIAVTAVAVLGQFGVETTSLLAVLGAAGLAIGLAMQGTLTNVAAGMMLLIFRPYRIEQFIEAAGKSGTVKDINLLFTVMATPDNVRIVVPNKDIWGATITNYSANETRRIDIVTGISYGDDIDRALEVVRTTVTADARVLGEPEPMAAVNDLGDSSVNLLARFWVNSADYWPARFDLTKRIKQALDENGVTIPFPTRTVYTKAAD